MNTTTRRRWVVRVHDQAGRMIAIEVRDGKVWAAIGDTGVQLDPADVSRVIAAYRQAQAVALQDRGRW